LLDVLTEKPDQYDAHNIKLMDLDVVCLVPCLLVHWR